MTAAARLLGRLAALGVQARAVGDEIRVRPIALVPLELRGELREHKAAILDVLRGATAAAPMHAPIPCDGCGAADWIVSLVDDRGRRTCIACATGRTALRRTGGSL